MLAAMVPGASGAVGICNFQDLTDRGGRLYWNEKRVHVVLEWRLGPSDPRVLSCLRAGSIGLYDGPISTVRSDKRNLALHSCHVDDDGCFSSTEREAIRSYIPWTHVLAADATTYLGETVFLPELLNRARASLVIRKAQSMGGKGRRDRPIRIHGGVEERGRSRPAER